MNLSRLTTDKFQDIVKYYDLDKLLSYFKIYNTSPFINGYHGFEHIKRMICALQYSFSFEKEYFFNYKECKQLITAAIFHDFNYLGTNSSDPEYDVKNVEEALSQYDTYCIREGIDRDVQVVDLIKKTEFTIAIDLKSREYFTDYQNLFIDTDFSSILFDEFPFQSLIYYLFDNHGEVDQESYINNLKSWNSKCFFVTPFFKQLFEKERASILEDSIDFVINKTVGMGFEYLANQYLNKRDLFYTDAKQYKFELVGK